MDRAVLDAYGWTDIPTDLRVPPRLRDDEDEKSGPTKKKPYRYRWPDDVRDEVLARLLELNAERAQEEARSGAAAAKPHRGRKAAAKSGGRDIRNEGPVFMTTTVRSSREIEGKGRTVRELLAGRKYSIDYYQREYKWQTKQVTELLDDLADKFLESYEAGDERSAVADYGHYFLGSIIISDKDGQKFIIDGQQRLTTLTLLLIYLHHQLEDAEQKGQIAELIFSQKYGKRSFNLDIPERTACMEALYTGEELRRQRRARVGRQHPRPLSPTSKSSFPKSSQDAALPYFADWLIENVHLVEITAYSDGDAYTIFETMNDRGLSLTPADMLKGYLLANITDADEAHAGQPRLEGAHQCPRRASARTRMPTASRPGCAASTPQSIRERKRGAAAAGLRPHRHRVPPLGARPRGPARPRRRAPTSPASSSATSPSTAAGTSGSGAPPRR